jgi:uncharacterized Zn-finger protein
MFDCDALGPYCEKKFKLNMIGLEAKEFISCPHCQRITRIAFFSPDRRGRA